MCFFVPSSNVNLFDYTFIVSNPKFSIAKSDIGNTNKNKAKILKMKTHIQMYNSFLIPNHFQSSKEDLRYINEMILRQLV